MNSNLLGILLYSGIVLLLSMLILLIPFPVLGKITSPFTFRTFGIRKIRRWNNHTDTLANAFLWLSLLFCIAYPAIPLFQVIYILWLTLAWLAALARAVRLKEVSDKWKRLSVVFCLNLLYGFALFGVLGLFNRGGLIYYADQFWKDIQSKEALHFMYYVTKPAFISYLTQFLLMFIPLYSFWSQFKYMRLENTYKGRFIGFYLAKELIVTAVVILLGTVSLGLIENMYGIPAEQQISEGYRPVTNSGNTPSEEEPAAESDESDASQTSKPEKNED